MIDRIAILKIWHWWLVRLIFNVSTIHVPSLPTIFDDLARLLPPVLAEVWYAADGNTNPCRFTRFLFPRFTTRMTIWWHLIQRKDPSVSHYFQFQDQVENLLRRWYFSTFLQHCARLPNVIFGKLMQSWLLQPQDKSSTFPETCKKFQWNQIRT